MVYLYGLKNNVIRCYFEIHMLSVVNYHGPGLIEYIYIYIFINLKMITSNLTTSCPSLCLHRNRMPVKCLES